MKQFDVIFPAFSLTEDEQETREQELQDLRDGQVADHNKHLLAIAGEGGPVMGDLRTGCDERGFYIRTFTGKQFFWDDIESNEVDIRDIAHALAMNCRWTGHVKHFYSVAQHSVLACQHAPYGQKLAALLHDAAEAYVHDTPSPLKWHLKDKGFTAFADLDERVDRLIWKTFGLTWPRDPVIKEIDLRLLSTEHRDLMHPGDESKYMTHPPYDERIERWIPEKAERVFLELFDFWFAMERKYIMKTATEVSNAPARPRAGIEPAAPAVNQDATGRAVPRYPANPYFPAEEVRTMDEDNLNREPRLPADAAARKAIPLCDGVLDYFPDALAAVAELSKKGNDQHNPGQPLHWSRGKSGDHPNTILRHLVDRGTIDNDGVRHSTKVAWRALAQLQEEIERAEGKTISRGSRAA